MATQQLPDPTSLARWEDAFQHPLPVVRKLEQQLRTNIDDHRRQLRALVGARYRDLLGTADRIVDMHRQMHDVERQLADLGRRCHAGAAVARVAENHARLQAAGRAAGGGASRRHCARLAQTQVVQRAIAAAARLVARRGDALLAAKLLVLARLVLRSLDEPSSPPPPPPPAILPQIAATLAHATTRLLAYIARALATPPVDGPAHTVAALCAYALVATAAPGDVLRHFLHTRLQQLDLRADCGRESDVREMLDLYRRTLLESSELFPRRFADALAPLASGALVADGDLRAVAGLSLDIYERWLADDVRRFHIWARPDRLPVSDVTEAVASWTRQAQSRLARALKRALAEQSDAPAVLRLRHHVLSQALSLRARLRSDIHARAIHDLRAAFLERLEELADQAAALADFAPHALPPSPEQRDPPASSHTVWDLAAEPMDLSAGAVVFRQAVLHQRHGRTTAATSSATSFTHILDAWLARLRAYAEAIASMRTLRWDRDRDLDEDDLEDDLEDDDPVRVTLGTHDPQQLERRLSRATATSLHAAYAATEKAFGSDSDSDPDPAVPLRVLRAIDLRRRALSGCIADVGGARPDRAFITRLHEQLATGVADEPLRSYAESARRRRSHTPVTLWEGSPPLPVQPSPAAFAFLKSLHAHMSTVGADLWSPAAVRTLKTHLAAQLSTHMAEEMVPSAGGHTDAPQQQQQQQQQPNDDAAAAQGARPRLMQLLFDLRYLQQALAMPDAAPDDAKPLRALADGVQTRGHVHGAAAERVVQGAAEYWRRTHLLFALLATTPPARAPAA